LEDNKYFGLYRGIVVNNDDPEKRSRVTLRIPQVLGTNVTDWAWPCLPITVNESALNHQEHTASQVAALLTTQSTTSPDPQGGTVTIPALTVVAKAGAGTLKHPHVASSDALTKNGSEDGLTAAEHVYPRTVPNVNQGVWVMFEGGDPNFPVWIGVF
jgi:hypothetical protein